MENNEARIMELIQLIAGISPGPSPSEGFVPSGPTIGEPGRLGMSPEASTMGSGLQALQVAGVRPSMPGTMPGNFNKHSLLELIGAIIEKRRLEDQSLQQQQPGDPAVFQSGAGVGSEGNRDLLQKLLDGS